MCLDTANYLTMWCVNLEVQEVRGRGYRGRDHMLRGAGSLSHHTHRAEVIADEESVPPDYSDAIHPGAG